MIAHAWTVICEKTVIDRESNNLSIDVLEQLQIVVENIPVPPEVGLLPFNLRIASMWYRESADPEQGTARYVLQDPANKTLGQVDTAVDLTKPRNRVILQLAELAVTTSGVYFICVAAKDDSGNFREVARVPLQVELQVGSSRKLAGVTTPPVKG